MILCLISYNFALHVCNLVLSNIFSRTSMQLSGAVSHLAPFSSALCSTNSNHLSLSFSKLQSQSSQFTETVVPYLSFLSPCNGLKITSMQKVRVTIGPISFIFLLSGITVLQCLLFSIWKQLFHLLCLVSYLFMTKS